ncbi:hypothetical protein GCM10020295_47250 [Streptomyces cinereospinus]
MGDSTPADRYLDAAIGLLQRVREEEAEAVAAAGALLAGTVAAGGGCSPSAPGTPRSPRRTWSTAPAGSP